MAKISVIVPVYKVEKYICRCVDSLLKQTYPDMEIILVDDGSPDKCGQLCDRYAEEYSHVRVIHKENGGLSSARNAGIAAATGAYIGFVDSDDSVEPEMYARLYEILVANGADISICNCTYVDEETGTADEMMRQCSPLKDEVLDRVQALEKLNPAQDGYSFYVTAWNKLYRRELFEECLFREGWIHEDEFLVHHIFSRCNRVATLADSLYLYVQRKGSITNTGVNVKMLDGVYALYDRYSFFEREGMRQLAKECLLAAEWKLRTLLAGLPKDAQLRIKNLLQQLIPKLIIYCRPGTVLLLKAWFQYIHRIRQ